MSLFVKGIEKQFQEIANAEKAIWSKAYMKDQFDFFGIETATRRKLTKEYFKQTPIDFNKQIQSIVEECFNRKEREFQYFAVELISFYKKEWNVSIIKTLEYCILHKSWWDSVDHVCSECLDDYFNKFPEKIITVTQKWNQSENIWLQRSSIMFQKFFKEKTDTELLSKYILHTKDSKDFFVQKAIGWALREYAKTNPNWVQKFVTINTNSLPALSKREALKHFSKE